MNGIVLVFHCPVAKGCAAGFFHFQFADFYLLFPLPYIWLLWLVANCIKKNVIASPDVVYRDAAISSMDRRLCC